MAYNTCTIQVEGLTIPACARGSQPQFNLARARGHMLEFNVIGEKAIARPPWSERRNSHTPTPRAKVLTPPMSHDIYTCGGLYMYSQRCLPGAPRYVVDFSRQAKPRNATMPSRALFAAERAELSGARTPPNTNRLTASSQRQRSGGKGNGAPLQRRATAAKTPSGHLQQQSQHQSTRKGARNNSTVSLSPSTSPLPDAAAADTLHRRTSLASMASLLRRCAFLGTQLNSWLTLLAMGAVLLLQLRAVSLMGYHCLMRRKKGRTEGRDSALQPMAAALPCGPILCVQCVARRGERRGGQKSSP